MSGIPNTRRGPLTVERVKELVSYDPFTGIWTRNVPNQRFTIGSPCGTMDSKGYWAISIDGKKFRAHRLAFLYMTGVLPAKHIDVDHIDLDRTNCRWENLRLCTRSQNQMNRSLQSNSNSGLKGVCWRKDLQKWASQTQFGGKYRHLGYFTTKEDAHAAYVAAAQRLAGEFARAA